MSITTKLPDKLESLKYRMGVLRPDEKELLSAIIKPLISQAKYWHKDAMAELAKSKEEGPGSHYFTDYLARKCRRWSFLIAARDVRDSFLDTALKLDSKRRDAKHKRQMLAIERRYQIPARRAA